MTTTTSSLFQLVFNRGDSEVTVNLSPRSKNTKFNPDAHQPKMMVATLEMLQGVAVQDSGPVYGGQTISISGLQWDKTQIDLINSYIRADSRPDVTYRDNRQATVEEWPVTISKFTYSPYTNIVSEDTYNWAFELVTLGKYDTDGVTILS
jgi:hypothetical protein